MGSSDFSYHFPKNFTCVLISSVTYLWLYDGMRSLLFRYLLLQHSARSTPKGSSMFSYSNSTSSMVFVRKSVTRLPLVPYRANVTMLQDSLYVTDCYFAPVSHRHTSLQHNRSPKSIGGSLQGSLAITLTRLSLAS